MRRPPPPPRARSLPALFIRVLGTPRQAYLQHFAQGHSAARNRTREMWRGGGEVGMYATSALLFFLSGVVRYPYLSLANQLTFLFSSSLLPHPLTLAGHHEYPESLAHITGASCISLKVSGGPSSAGLPAALVALLSLPALPQNTPGEEKQTERFGQKTGPKNHP